MSAAALLPTVHASPLGMYLERIDQGVQPLSIPRRDLLDRTYQGADTAGDGEGPALGLPLRTVRTRVASAAEGPRAESVSPLQESLLGSTAESRESVTARVITLDIAGYPVDAIKTGGLLAVRGNGPSAADRKNGTPVQEASRFAWRRQRGSNPRRDHESVAPCKDTAFRQLRHTAVSPTSCAPRVVLVQSGVPVQGHVGLTNNPARRMEEHSLDKPWFLEIDHIDVECFGFRFEAEDAERVAIWQECPKYNVLRLVEQTYVPSRGTRAGEIVGLPALVREIARAVGDTPNPKNEAAQ
jgi:hypothetical protein